MKSLSDRFTEPLEPIERKPEPVRLSREEIRAAMTAADPQLLEFADLLREKFNAKLVYLQTPTLELGQREWTSQLQRQKAAAAKFKLPANSVWCVYRFAKESQPG